MKPSVELKHSCRWLRSWRTPTSSSTTRWTSSRLENRWRYFGKYAYRTTELLEDIDVQRVSQKIRVQVHSKGPGTFPLVFQLWQEHTRGSRKATLMPHGRGWTAVRR